MHLSLQEKKFPEDVFLCPDAGNRKSIESGASADIVMCWTCSSCDLECPVNIATNMLRPQKLVRLANLGIIDELLCIPEIWYCLTCRRCDRICPNAVKPSYLIGYIRQEALRRGIISWKKFRRYNKLFTRFQKARWRAAAVCMNGAIPEIPASRWQEWMDTPLKDSLDRVISGKRHAAVFSTYQDLFREKKGSLCFACGECSSVCPVSCHRSVFDPRCLFRLVQLGLIEEALKSPAIWLCLNCGRCTDACSQKVDGCAIIERLRELTIENGILDKGFFYRLEQANRKLLPWFLDAVDDLLGFSAKTQDSCLERVHP